MIAGLNAPGFKLLMGLSLAVHLLLAICLLWQGLEPENAIRPASLTVSLGSSGSSAGAIQSQPRQPQVTRQTEPEHVEEVSAAPELRRPVAQAHARPQPAQPENTTEIEEVPNAATETVERQPQLEGNQGLSGDDATEQSLDTDGVSEVFGHEALSRSYDDIILARFSQAKRYPPRARMRGVEGFVGVQFTLAADGALLSAHIVETSGRRVLDRAALEQVSRAQPYPPRPNTLDWETRTYRTEVQFSLRDTRN